MTSVPNYAQRDVWSASPPEVPARVWADGERVRWGDAPAEGHDWPGTAGLLEDFTALAGAEAEGIAAFVAAYGVPELCAGHGRPDRHDGGCPLPRNGQGGYLSARTVRRAARAVAALRRLALGLNVRAGTAAADWQAVQLLLGATFPLPVADWRAGRGQWAAVMTALLRDGGVAPAVEWGEQGRLAVGYEADGLLGVLLVLVAREAGLSAENTYRCDSCGQPVHRRRAPRPGDGVFCENSACKREQFRRNQARSRARQRTRGGNGDQ